MSVLACDRKGCENVMCDRLSHEFGYICYECFDELVKLGVQTDIREFMRSDKGSRAYHNYVASSKYFSEVFPPR